jgi:exodeoxyribonuclease VII small subunit
MATDKTGAKLSYEAARDELAQVVSALEGGQSSLEESLALWERGEVLAKICQEWLDGAKAKLAAVRPDESSSSSEKK